MLQPQYAGHQLDRPAATADVSEIALWGSDRHISQYGANRPGFPRIILDRTGRMCIDVADFVAESDRPYAKVPACWIVRWRLVLAWRRISAAKRDAPASERKPAPALRVPPANSSRSRTKAAAPSPLTIPSRSASNGRQAAAGISIRGERRSTPRYSMGVILRRELLPPLIITSAWPRRMMDAASIMASRLDTSPWQIVLFGPRASWAMAMWQAIMFGRYMSIQSGYISAAKFGPHRSKWNSPFSMQRWCTATISSGSQ